VIGDPEDEYLQEIAEDEDDLELLRAIREETEGENQ